MVSILFFYDSDCDVRTEYEPGDFFLSQRGAITLKPYSAFRRNRLYIRTSLEQKVVSMISKPSISKRRSIYISMFDLRSKTPQLEWIFFMVLTNYMHQGSIYRVAPMVCMDI